MSVREAMEDVLSTEAWACSALYLACKAKRVTTCDQSVTDMITGSATAMQLYENM